MKLIDAEKGKLFGVNVVDFFVLLLVVFLLFSFASKLLKPDFVYSGEEMYSAIQDYKKLDSKGFLVEAEIEGKWIVDEQEFRGRGVIAETRSGSFALRWKNGGVIWIGGSMAYLEDIAASRITFIPSDAYVAAFPIEAREFGSYADFIAYLEEKKAKLGADSLRVGGSSALPADIAFINPSSSAQEILNQFGKLYKIKYHGILQTREEETIIRVRLADLEELRKISIASSKVVVSEAYLYAGYKERPLLLDARYHVASLEDLK
jgi:hypothetical protein